MILVSQNLLHYKMQLPKKAVFRVNLAWINNLTELDVILKSIRGPIFLDLPTDRIKPPNNSYTIKQLLPYLQKYKDIQYFAVSNVDSPKNLLPYRQIPTKITLVPKIETVRGIKNISSIIDALPAKKKVLMLDHDDLWTSVIKVGLRPVEFTRYIKRLSAFCKRRHVILLRMRGNIFASEK